MWACLHLILHRREEARCFFKIAAHQSCLSSSSFLLEKQRALHLYNAHIVEGVRMHVEDVCVNGCTSGDYKSQQWTELK